MMSETKYMREHPIPNWPKDKCEATARLAFNMGIESEKERIIKWLNKKEIGKGKDETFDEGAYRENREIKKFVLNQPDDE